MIHYVDQNNEYIGAFGGMAVVPNGAIAVPDRPSKLHTWDGSTWAVDPAEILAAERATMVCSPMQGILTLGETEWAKVIAYRDTQATWAERVIIDSALDWRRTSQNIAFFGFLLNYTDEQMDSLFRAAIAVDA